MTITATAAPVAATEKQVKYLTYLVGAYYRDQDQREKRDRILARLGDRPHLTKCEASRIIGILKHLTDVLRVCDRLLLAGRGGATRYYAANVDIWDTEEDDFIEGVWARI